MNAPPVTIGVETAVTLCMLLNPDAGQAFSTLANGHRAVSVVPYVHKLTRYLTPHEECGAYGCGQTWPCDIRRALNIIEALVAAIAKAESAPSGGGA